MTADVVGQPVVLLLLEGGVVEGAVGGRETVGVGPEEEVHEGGVVEDAVYVGAHAAVIGDVAVVAAVAQVQQGLRRGVAEGPRLAHVNLVATSELTVHLAGDLVASHRGGDGQEAEARQALDVTLHVVGVAHLDAHQLIAAADAEHRGALATGPDDGLGTAVAPQLAEVAEGRLGAGQDDDVGGEYVAHVAGVEEVNALVALQGVEVGIVGEMPEQHHCHVDAALLHLPRLAREGHAVLLLDADVVEIGHHAEHGHAADVLQHAAPLVEEAQVAPELVDDDAPDEPAVVGRLEGDAAIDGGEHAATVDVAHEYDVGSCVAGHREVHQVGVAEIEFGDAAGALHHDGIVARGQAVEGGAHLAAEVGIEGDGGGGGGGTTAVY